MDFGTLDEEEENEEEKVAVLVNNLPSRQEKMQSRIIGPPLIPLPPPPPSQSNGMIPLPLPPPPPSSLPLPPLPLPPPKLAPHVVAPLVDDENDDLFNAALDAIEAEEREKNLKRELEEQQRKKQHTQQQQMQQKEMQQQQLQQQQQQQQQQLRDNLVREQEKQGLAQEQERFRNQFDAAAQHLPQQPIPQKSEYSQPIYRPNPPPPQPQEGRFPPQNPPPQRLVLPPTATAPLHTPSQRIIATSGAAITSSARDVANNKTVPLQDMNIDSEESKKRKNMSNTSNQAHSHPMVGQAELVAQGAPLWLAALGNTSNSGNNNNGGGGGGGGDSEIQDFKLNGAWLQMCLDLSIWPGLWQPLMDYRRQRPDSFLKSDEEFREYIDDIPEGCNVDTVTTLRTFNVDFIRHKQPAPAALARMINLVVRIVSLWPSSEVNDVAIVEDPTGQLAAVVLRKAAEVLVGDALSPGAVILLQKVSVAVLGSCQTLIISPRSVLSFWGADTPDPRKKFVSLAQKSANKKDMGGAYNDVEEDDDGHDLTTSPSL